MYGLPIDISLAFFSGRRLLQVCFGMHDLILNFDENVTLTVSSSIGYATESNATSQHVDFREAAPLLCSLIDRTVIMAENDGIGMLTLMFEGNVLLCVYDDSTAYESYTIRVGERLIVV